MSLGFLTESALVPKKGKEISVGSSSLVDLKAAVFRAEQERGAGERGSVRGKKRSRPSKRQRAGLSIGGKNVGVDRRAARDAAVAAGDAERAAKKLRAKAKLYEKLSRGGRYSDGDDDDRGENGRAECLVDFDMKPRHDLHATHRRRRRGSDSSGSDDDAGVLQSQHEYGKVTIVDEFGRERVLSKRSSEYKRHVEEQRRRQREERRAQREALRDLPSSAPDPVPIDGSVRQQYELAVTSEDRKAELKRLSMETEQARMRHAARRLRQAQSQAYDTAGGALASQAGGSTSPGNPSHTARAASDNDNDSSGGGPTATDVAGRASAGEPAQPQTPTPSPRAEPSRAAGAAAARRQRKKAAADDLLQAALGL